MEKLLHERLLAAVLGGDKGIELFEGHIPGGEDVGNLVLFGKPRKLNL